MLLYNEANKKVAILCNHQKTVSKAQETALETLGDRLQLVRTSRPPAHESTRTREQELFFFFFSDTLLTRTQALTFLITIAFVDVILKGTGATRV